MIIAVWIFFGIFVVLGLGYLGLRQLGKRAGRVHADEVHMVLTRDVWRIRLCRYRSRLEGVEASEPILFCHGFMSNQFNFTLPDGESMVDYFCERGYDCWTIDLRGNLSSVAPFGRTHDEPTLDDYVQYDIPAAIDYIRKATGAEKVHWIGHSMGGMLLYAREATVANGAIASGTTLGSPIGFEGMHFHRPTPLFWLRRIVGRYAFRGGMRALLTLFTRIKPNLKLMPLNWSNMHRAFDNPNVFYAAADAPPVAVAEGLADAAQMKKWVVLGDVDVYERLKGMRTPLFAIFGAADPLVPAETIENFFDGLQLEDKKLLVLSKDNGFGADYSHLDLVFGKDAPTEVFQPILEWLRHHPIAAAPEADSATRAPRKSSPRKAPASKPKALPAADETHQTEEPAPVEAAVETPVETAAPARAPRKAPARKKPAARQPVAEKVIEDKEPAVEPAQHKPATRKPAARKPAARRKKVQPEQ